MISSSKISPVYLLFLIAGLFFYLPLYSSDLSFIWGITKEDALYENAGALFFLLTSLAFLVTYIRSKKGNNFYWFSTKKNIFFLLLALLFFVGFGEEISWGQRLFHLNTPEYIQTHNMQGEINLHNLEWFHRFADPEQKQVKPFWQLMLNFGRLYILFWFTFCLLIPLANSVNARLASFFRSVNIPIVPLWIGVFFLANYLLSNILFTQLGHGKITPLMEIKETISSYLFLIVAVFFVQKRHMLSSNNKE
jgi:hypothetical protein